jgi:molybdate transport system ATP-binding protein
VIAAGGPAGAGLRADLRLARGRLDLDVALDVAPGRTLGLLGPNGAGKSTTVALLAGLLRPDDGRVELAGRVLTDVTAGRVRAEVPVPRRGVGVVFQDHLLFAHLSALENVAFGPRARGVPAASARAGARRWLEALGVGELAGARPRQLSGGQAQRVALARALAGEPGLLLLDEPLAALDAATRAAVRSELARHLRAYPGCAVLVTHDPLDAMVLADHLVVLEGGRVVQQGAPAEVAGAPRTAYVAALVGLVLLRGRARRAPAGTEVVLEDGAVVVSSDPVAAGPALAAFAPSAVALHRMHPQGSARNAWAGTVAGVESRAGVVRVRVAGALGGTDVLADVTPAAVADLALDVGAPVWASVKATEVRAYPA